MYQNLQSALFEPVVQVRHKSIIMFDRYIGPRASGGQNKLRSENMAIQRSKAYNGQLSSGARKRMIKAINLLCAMTEKRTIYNPIIKRNMPHMLSFLTLTISDTAKNYTSRETYKSCLRPFIQWLTKTHRVKLYVWVAELQKRGQVHYHMAFPNFVDYQEIRNKWNYLQAKAGYLNGFRDKYGHSNPNSTDIHSMSKIRDAASYLSKYMSKRSQRSEIMDGKLWDCSLILKTAKYFEAMHSTTLEAMIKRACATGRAVLKQLERCAVLYFSGAAVSDLLPYSDFIKYRQYYRSLWVQAHQMPDDVPK